MDAGPEVWNHTVREDFMRGSDELHGGELIESAQQIRELDCDAQLVQLTESRETLEVERLKCRKCPARIILPRGVVSGFCPFCGSNLSLTAEHAQLIRPDALHPFRITRRQASEFLQCWISRFWFIPGTLKAHARSEGNLTAVYVPFWTYDCRAACLYSGERGDDYWEPEKVTVFEEGRPVLRTRLVRRTRWTSVSGTVHDTFSHLLVPATDSLAGECLRMLEPWDLQQLVPFSEEHLSGFRTESYRLSVPEGFKKARESVYETIRTSVRRDIGGDHQRTYSVRTQYDAITFKHILLPVWLSAYRFKGKVYRFVLNARTGEVQGERPWSAWKISVTVLVLLLVIAVLLLISSPLAVN